MQIIIIPNKEFYPFQNIEQREDDVSILHSHYAKLHSMINSKAWLV